MNEECEGGRGTETVGRQSGARREGKQEEKTQLKGSTPRPASGDTGEQQQLYLYITTSW